MLLKLVNAMICLPLIAAGQCLRGIGWLIQQLFSPNQEDLVREIEFWMPRAYSPGDRTRMRELLAKLKERELLTTELIAVQEELRDLTSRKKHPG